MIFLQIIHWNGFSLSSSSSTNNIRRFTRCLSRAEIKASNQIFPPSELGSQGLAFEPQCIDMRIYNQRTNCPHGMLFRFLTKAVLRRKQILNIGCNGFHALDTRLSLTFLRHLAFLFQFNGQFLDLHLGSSPLFLDVAFQLIFALFQSRLSFFNFFRRFSGSLEVSARSCSLLYFFQLGKFVFKYLLFHLQIVESSRCRIQ